MAAPTAKTTVFGELVCAFVREPPRGGMTRQASGEHLPRVPSVMRVSAHPALLRGAPARPQPRI